MNKTIIEEKEKIIQKFAYLKQNEILEEDLELIFKYIDLLNESVLGYDDDGRQIAHIIFDVYHNFMEVVDSLITQSNDLYVISKSIIYFEKLNYLFRDGIDTVTDGTRHSPGREILIRDDAKFNALKDKQVILQDQMKQLSDEQKEIVKEARNTELSCTIHKQ